MSDSQPSGGVQLQTCQCEVRELHQFFEDWLGGRCPDTDEAFARVRDALAPDFHLIHPSGTWRTQADILEGLRQNHGVRPGLTIQIRDVRLLRAEEELLLATYEEWQEGPDATDGRLSTVVFGRTADGPNGLFWQHVHETWLQEA